jgi:hypothetical protein
MAMFCEKHCIDVLGIKREDDEELWNAWCCEGTDYPCEECGFEHCYKDK